MSLSVAAATMRRSVPSADLHRAASSPSPRSACGMLPAMNCLGCGYELSGLPAGSCPECGRAFDPANERTYTLRRWEAPPRWLFALTVAGLAWPTALHLWMHAMLLAARVQLGRWPHMHGMDDPSGIGGLVPVFMGVALLAFAATPIVMLLALLGLAALWAPDRQRGLIAAAAILLAWIALLAIGDPMDVWVWFLD